MVGTVSGSPESDGTVCCSALFGRGAAVPFPSMGGEGTEGPGLPSGAPAGRPAGTGSSGPAQASYADRENTGAAEVKRIPMTISVIALTQDMIFFAGPDGFSPQGIRSMTGFFALLSSNGKERIPFRIANRPRLSSVI